MFFFLLFSFLATVLQRCGHDRRASNIAFTTTTTYIHTSLALPIIANLSHTHSYFLLSYSLLHHQSEIMSLIDPSFLSQYVILYSLCVHNISKGKKKHCLYVVNDRRQLIVYINCVFLHNCISL